MRYLRGTDLGGHPLPVRDARLTELQPLAREGGSDPRPLLARREIFGDLIQDAPFVAAVQRSLEGLDRGGVDPLLVSCLGSATSNAA
jgi:fructuronate reductase/mannitol 2-dehydrogenase